MSTAPEQLLTNAQYHALDSVSHSKLEQFRQSRAKFRAVFIDETIAKEQTAAMQLGSLVHAIVLEPHSFSDLYAIAPKCDKRTNAGKAEWASFISTVVGDQEIVEFDVVQKARDIAKAVYANPLACELLFDHTGKTETPMFWTCPVTGIECRSKPDVDRELAGGRCLVDLKTCQSASPAEFGRAAANYGYGRQDAWYRWGYEMVTGVNPNFVFVAVSTNAPYEVGVYETRARDLSRSRMQNADDLRAFAECMASGDWRSRHEQEITPLAIPKWAGYED
jgi:hypothetical protein